MPGTVDCDDGYARTAPVGSFTENQYGLHDMLGNVFEWVQDCSIESYWGAPTDGSAWERGYCTSRQARGGSWISPTNELRAASRVWQPWNLGLGVNERFFNLGFRVARSLTS